MAYIEGEQRSQHTLFPTTLDEVYSDFVGFCAMSSQSLPRGVPQQHDRQTAPA
jgi:hypothetical protein